MMPAAVRYAWSNYPQCVLFEHALPVGPFNLSVVMKSDDEDSQGQARTSGAPSLRMAMAKAVTYDQLQVGKPAVVPEQNGTEAESAREHSSCGFIFEFL